MFFYSGIYGIKCHESLHEKSKWEGGIYPAMSHWTPEKQGFYKKPAYGYHPYSAKWSDGKCRKLSEHLQHALEERDFLDGYVPETQHPVIRYSKRIQGEDMLRHVNPGTILHTCSFYFREGFLALQAL